MAPELNVACNPPVRVGLVQTLALALKEEDSLCSGFEVHGPWQKFTFDMSKSLPVERLWKCILQNFAIWGHKLWIIFSDLLLTVLLCSQSLKGRVEQQINFLMNAIHEVKSHSAAVFICQHVKCISSLLIHLLDISVLPLCGCMITFNREEKGRKVILTDREMKLLLSSACFVWTRGGNVMLTLAWPL